MAIVKIISGIQNSGKTTLAADMVRKYRQQGYTAAGFLSDAEYNAGEKDTYYFRDLITGKREKSVCSSIPAGELFWVKYEFSRFYFSDRAFDFARKLLSDAADASKNDQPDYLFVDELGPLELTGKGLFEPVKQLVNCYQGTLCLVIRESLIEALSEKLCLKADDVEIIKPCYHAQ